MRHLYIFILFLAATLQSCQGDRLVSTNNIAPDPYPQNDHLWGFMSRDGSVVIPAQYDEVLDFHEGLAAFRRGYLWGYINQAGQEVIKPTYLQAYSFSDHLARVVSVDSRTFFISPSGKTTFDVDCRKAGNFSNNRAPVWSNKKVGYINSKGLPVISPKYEDAHEFDRGVAIVKAHSKYGLIDIYGKYIIAPKYDFIFLDKNATDRLCLLKKNGLVGYYNLKTQKYNKPKYQAGEPYFQQSAVVRKDSLFGAINSDGEWTVLPIFTELINLGESRWALRFEGEYFMIDSTGLQQGEGFQQVYRFSEGLATAQIDHKWGYVNTGGEFVIQPIYDLIWPFHHGKARVSVESGVGFIDKKGQYIIQPQFADIRDFSEGLARFNVPR